MSSKLSARRGNPGTPPVCKSKKPPLPEPPSQPICDPSTVFAVQVIADWDEGGTHYHWEANYECFSTGIGTPWFGQGLTDPYDSFATIQIIDSPCHNLLFDLWVTYHNDSSIHVVFQPIPCEGETPQTWTFPPGRFSPPSPGRSSHN